MRTPPHGPVRLEAVGVVLRPYAPGDVPDLKVAFVDAEIARWSPAPSGPRPTEEFMRSRNDWSVGDHASWAVAEPGGRLVGSVSVHKIDRDQRDAQMGYWIAPWARGQGYADSVHHDEHVHGLLARDLLTRAVDGADGTAGR